jgi:hypothetical protein
MRVVKCVKEQVDQDNIVVGLCSKMSEAYVTAHKSKILARVVELHDIIQTMIQQTVECSVFIKEYIGKGFGSKSDSLCFKLHFSYC